MSNQSQVTRKRAVAHKWLTNASHNLDKLLGDRESNRFVYEHAINEFDRRLEAFDVTETEFEIECEESELDNEIDEIAKYRDEVTLIRAKASEVLSRLREETKGDSDSEIRFQNHSNRARPEVKLPKLVLPKFSGDVLQWQSFWDQFTAAVHLSDLPDINKFTYLRSLLEGEAQEAIQGLALTEQHYRVACQILQERFGRKERIIFKHVQELLNLSSVTKNNSMSGLQKLQDMLLSHVRSLESLGIAGDNYGVLLTPIVLSSLPADIRMQWARVSDGEKK